MKYIWRAVYETRTYGSARGAKIRNYFPSTLLKPTEELKFIEGAYFLFVKNNTEKDVKVTFELESLTKEGVELRNALHIEISLDSLKKMGINMREKYTTLTISLHKINYHKGKIINYNKEDLL